MNKNLKRTALLTVGPALLLWLGGGCSRKPQEQLPPMPPTGAVQPLASPVRAPSAQARPIDEKEVQALLKAMDAASSKKDVKTMMNFLADDATVHLSVNGPLGLMPSEMNRKDYEAEITKLISQVTDYTCEGRDVKVKVAADGRNAEASETVVESLTSKGQKFTQESLQTYSLVRRNGKWLVQTLYSVPKHP